VNNEDSVSNIDIVTVGLTMLMAGRKGVRCIDEVPKTIITNY
jgi:hypothetical protein